MNIPLFSLSSPISAPHISSVTSSPVPKFFLIYFIFSLPPILTSCHISPHFLYVLLSLTSSTPSFPSLPLPSPFPHFLDPPPSPSIPLLGKKYDGQNVHVTTSRCFFFNLKRGDHFITKKKEITLIKGSSIMFLGNF